MAKTSRRADIRAGLEAVQQVTSIYFNIWPNFLPSLLNVETRESAEPCPDLLSF